MEDDDRHPNSCATRTRSALNIETTREDASGKELYDRMQGYLAAARSIYSQSSDGNDLNARMIRAFPDYGGVSMLDQQMRFLFPAVKP